MVWDQYTWIFVCSVMVALLMSWGIGANDVANAFGTSVGARALTLRQAVLVASVCEFGGAVLLGSGVTDTIRSGIAKISAYTYSPELLMYGMLCALTAASLWLVLATFLELPVSTTHSIVGAIIGFSLVAAGGDSVVWTASAPPGSPFPTGFVSIVLAWFITPAIALVVAALMFQFTKMVVLYAKNPYRRALMLFPCYAFITIWVVTYFIIQKGVNNWMKNHNYGCGGCDSASKTCPWQNCSCPAGADTGKNPSKNSNGDWVLTGCAIPDGTNAWISAVTASVVTILCIIGLKWVDKLVNRDLKILEDAEAEIERKLAAKEAGKIEGGGKDSPADGASEDAEAEAAAAAAAAPKRASRTPKMLSDLRRSKVWTAVTHGSSVNIHDAVVDNENIGKMHASAEVFDRKSELAFKYLQVCTACANSFAHGSNDVANAIGPFAAIYAIWQCACTTSKSTVPIWMFVIGGVGIVIGLLTYGYNIMRALGVKVTKLTNARGYCAELTAAIVVIVSSRYGFPVSTTQVITGAITGIGLLEVLSAKIRGQPAAFDRLNWNILLKFFAGWVATLVVAGLTAAAFTAQGIYAPNRPMVNDRENFNAAIAGLNKGMANLLANGTVSNTSANANVTAINAAKSCVPNVASGAVNSINSEKLLAAFQNGTYCVGNATLSGALANASSPTTYFMPPLPYTTLSSNTA